LGQVSSQPLDWAVDTTHGGDYYLTKQKFPETLLTSADLQ
jgi:hypothetical protein